MKMQLKRVLICDNVHLYCSETLRSVGVEAVVKNKMTKEELLKEIETCDGIIVRSATKVTEDVIKAGKLLKLIGRAGVGVDNIDVNEATKNGVIVMNTPTGNSISAAELTCTLISSLSRETVRAAASLKEGKWDRKAFMGEEIYGKTIAIVGLGNIGMEVAKRLQSFGMRTIGFDPIVSAETAKEAGVEKMELHELWPLADYITVHTPLIPQTKNMINAEVFSKCKKGVRVVNVARGGIVDEAALLQALESGQCAGAGLDVFMQEPPKDLSLVRHPKVIPTPHLGANTKEAQHRVAVEITQQFVDFIQGRPLKGLVNAPALANAYTPHVKPWITLGTTLSKLIASFVPCSQQSAYTTEIVLYGEKVENLANIVVTSVLTGIMQRSQGSKVNMVNASILAKQVGIPVKATCVTKPQQSLEISFMKDGVSQYSVTGCIQGETVRSYNIAGACFLNGVTLKGNLAFFCGNSESFSKITEELSRGKASIQSIVRSETCKNSCVWYMVRSAEPLQDSFNIPNTKLMAQVSF